MNMLELVDSIEKMVNRLDDIIADDVRLCEMIRVEAEITLWEMNKSLNDLRTIKQFI